jgi:hypothetical protein
MFLLYVAKVLENILNGLIILEGFFLYIDIFIKFGD